MKQVINPILKTDMYNYSHFYLIPETGRKDIQVSHLYNRGKPMILYGLNKIIKEIANIKITKEMVEEAKQALEGSGEPFPYELWMNVVTECNGYLPLIIEALPDGSWVPKGTPFCQIRNSVEGYGELVTHIEAILMKSFFGSACATEAFHISEYLKKNKLPANRVHSFGYRGHRSEEDAQTCTEAMLLFMPGSDDSHGLQLCGKGSMGSIPALAHKVVQQWDNEYDCYTHAVNWAATTENKIVAMVIDTYNADNFISEHLLPIARYASAMGVRIVFRPDSGDVLEQTIRIYCQLAEHGLAKDHNVIIGEGMSFKKIKTYDRKLKEDAIPLSFVYYGIGGGFYQDINRDTLGFAMKTAEANEKPRMKFSNDPIKRSIPGRVKLIRHEVGLVVYNIDENQDRIGQWAYEDVYLYDPYYHAVPKFKEQTWEQIKDLANNVETRQEKVFISSGIIKIAAELEQKYCKQN